MEGIKEKGFIRRFFEWLGKVDEDTIDAEGSINEKAFSKEDPKIIAELKKQSKKIDNMGSTMFVSKEQQRKETVKVLKAKVNQPAIEKSVQQKSEKDREEI